MKRVLLVVVDGCTSRLLGPALAKGELPFLSLLGNSGSLRLDCVSIFPSITPAATASIVTGRYPSRHGIGGMSWLNPGTDEISYFGDDLWTVLKRGPGEFVREFLVHLNGDDLKAPTLFQLVERAGRRAACFNHLIFRGDVAHELVLPRLLRLFPSVNRRVTVQGPSWLCLGDFISANHPGDGLSKAGGATNRFGLNDRGTIEFLMNLPVADALPDFSVAYFADYDFESHANGPVPALDTLKRLDAGLGDLFAHWGGIERVLAAACVILTADHSHSDVGSDKTAAVALDDVLSDFRIAGPQSTQSESDVLLCPNMRAAEIYVRDETTEGIRRVCDVLLQEPRIDQIVWREGHSGTDEFVVMTRDRGTLRFCGARQSPQAARDEYGGWWEIEGDLSAVDASVDDGEVRYGAYPNALERIANGVQHPRHGRVWVTAKPGFEFKVPGQSVHHDGGSHGTLHQLDSVVPLFVAGAPEPTTWLHPPRTVDVAPLCARIVDVPFR